MASSSSPVWTTDPSQPVAIEIAESGYGSEEPVSVQALFKAAVDRAPERGALHREIEGTDDWQVWTYQQYYDDVMRAAKSLVKLGVEAFSGVCIIGFNSPEWLIADLAAIHAGAIPAGIYTTNGPDACQYVIDHCGASIIFVENQALMNTILSVKDRCSKLEHVVIWGEDPGDDADDCVMTWDAFMSIGDDVEDGVIEEITTNVNAGTCATLIYTSGTTGTPKGAMASHDNLTWTARLAWELLDQKDASVVLSYLPLSHIAAQMLDIYGPLASAGSVYFARPDALKGTLGQSLKKVRPTMFLSVPRGWEKIMDKMLAIGAQGSGLKKTIAGWAKKKGLEGNYNRQNGQSEPWGWFFASMLFGKIKAALGLDRCSVCATGAAPIGLETLEYFMSVDLPLMEVYGMSETSGLITVSRPGQYRTRSCGVTLPGTEMRIDSPDAEGNGEVIARGRQIFMGYLHEEGKTADTFDEDGFLHTGDIGKLDEDGYLYITGRIKELIITAGGENVAPVPIEDQIKAALHFVSNAMVIGDKRKFLSVLLTFKVEMNMDTGEPTQELTGPAQAALASYGIEATTVEEAIAHPDINDVVTAGIARANEHAVSRAQRVNKFALLTQDFSIPGGELTATQKLKRKPAAEKYAEVIEGIYDV